MARQSRNATTTPKTAELDLRAMQLAIPRLKKRIDELRNFTPSAINSSDEASQITTPLRASIDDTLVRTFGENTLEYNRYSGAKNFTYNINWTGPTPIHDIRAGLEDSKKLSIALLSSAIQSLEERIEEETVDQSVTKIAPARASTSSANRKVFIVHGHDDGARESVARFLEKIGFEAIILHEKANRGKTIIEKFEEHADVGFAVVLLTADDVGGVSPDNLQSRARQNVILELGYFIGRLGRDRVCALKSGNVEMPSDIFGVVYTPYDPSGAWQTSLGKELSAAEYDIDWNTIMN